MKRFAALRAQARTAMQHPLFLAIYAPSLIFAFAFGMLTPIMPLYAASFEVSYGLVGLVLSGNALGSLLGDVPAGLLLRRLGVRRVMLLGIAGLVLATLALFWAQSVAVVVALRLLAGFCQAMWGVARHSLLAEAVNIGARGRSIAAFGGLGRIGRFAGPALGGAAAGAFGLRAPFLVFGGLGVLILLITWRYLENVPVIATPPNTQHGGRLLATVREQARVLVTVGAGQTFAQMIRSGWRTLLPLYGADVLGLDVEAIGLLMSALSAVDMSLFVPTGIIMDRWGRKYAVVPSFSIQALGMALVPLTTGLPGLLAAALIIGFGNGLGSGTMMTLGADLAPPGARGEFLGVWRLIGDGGGMSGPLVVGVVADAFALPVAALVVAGCGLTAAAIFGLLMPETLRRDTRAPTVQAADR